MLTHLSSRLMVTDIFLKVHMIRPSGEDALGEYVQLIKMGAGVSFLDVPGCNFSKIRSTIKERQLSKFTFSNEIFWKIIDNAKRFGIQIAEITLFEDVPDELINKIVFDLEGRNYDELKKVIVQDDLNIKELEFIDRDSRIFRILSNGIVFVDDKGEFFNILEKIRNV